MKMSKPKRLFTMRMMAWSSFAGNSVWRLAKGKDKEVIAVERFSEMFDKPDQPPTHFFIRGKGKVKAKPKDVELIPAVSPTETYEDIYNLIQKYGAKTTGCLLGFDEASFGDAYPLGEIAALERHGAAMLYWLNKIAEIDYCIAKFFYENGVYFQAGNAYNAVARTEVVPPYDLWLHRKVQVEGMRNCSFRDSPFLGSFVYERMFGIFCVNNPFIDVLKWDKEFLSLGNLLIDGFDKLAKNKSDVQIIEAIAGKELAEWLHNNLTYDVEKLYKHITTANDDYEVASDVAHQKEEI